MYDVSAVFRSESRLTESGRMRAWNKGQHSVVRSNPSLFPTPWMRALQAFGCLGFRSTGLGETGRSPAPPRGAAVTCSHVQSRAVTQSHAVLVHLYLCSMLFARGPKTPSFLGQLQAESARNEGFQSSIQATSRL